MSILSRFAHALGFDHRGMAPAHWVAPTAEITVDQLQRDLNLNDDEIVGVAVSSMRHYGEPADSSETLHRAMQKFAGAKNAPALEPIHQHTQENANVTLFKPSYADQREAAAERAFRERIKAAARNRSPLKHGISFG